MLKQTQKLKEAVYYINQLDPEKAQVVFDRIFQNPFEQDISQLFSEKESNKIQQITQMNSIADLQNIQRAFSYLLMIAVSQKRFNEVEELLTNSGLDEDHRQNFLNAWQNYSSDYANMIKEKHAALKNQLQSLEWELCLDVDESHLPIQSVQQIGQEQIKQNSDSLYSQDQRNPFALINFKMVQNEQSEDFSLKLEKAQIQSLFENLDQIQTELDRLY